MAKNNNLIKLGDAISQIFKEGKLDEKYSVFSIRTNWETIVGVTVAKHTTQINFVQGLLYVSIDSPVIRNEVMYVKEDIITKVNHFCGKRLVRELIIK